MERKHPLPSTAMDAFHMMWGNFPESVLLIHKSREIIAQNKAADVMGVLKPGMKCSSVGTPETHKGCLANKALAKKKAAHVFIPLDDGHAVGFWIPLEGYPEYYLHFSVGRTIDYRTGKPRNPTELAQVFRKTEK